MANSLTKIKTNAIDDDAVTLAKQAAGTDGQIITYDASGNPTAIGPGTDGQVLTSTGAGSPPAFEAIPAAGATLTGSTDNTVCTVTGANAIAGEANLTWNGTTLNAKTGGDTYLRVTGDRGNSNNLHIGNLEFENANSSQGVIAEIRAITGDSGTQNTKGQLAFYTDDGSGYAERMRITSSGHLKIDDGNLVIGTAGKGIDFSTAAGSASGASASILEDYEEGTFDPQFTSGTGGGSLTASSNYANQHGKYVKVGNLVMLSMHIQCASSGTGSITGELRVSNLPFGNDGYAGVAVGFGLSQNLSNTHPNAAYMFGGGGTDLWLQERTPDVGQQPCDAAQVVNNTRIDMGVTYRTT